MRDGVAEVSHTNYWTISAYDRPGRLVSNTLPDASVMQIAWQGVYTTITDQTGKQRRQVSGYITTASKFGENWQQPSWTESLVRRRKRWLQLTPQRDWIWLSEFCYKLGRSCCKSG